MKRLIAILALAGGAAFAFLGAPSETVTLDSPSAASALPVDVMVLRAQSETDIVVSYGQMQARWQATLRSEVSGRVMSVSDAALVGANVRKGDILAVVEDSAQQLDLANQQAALTTARRGLAEERQRARIAEENWRKAGYGEPASALVLRQPQVAEAQAALASAELAVTRARYMLDATRIRAPFDGAIISRSISPGDHIQAGAEIAQIYDVSRLELRLQLSAEELARLDLHNGAQVRLISDQTQLRWTGVVSRVAKQVDQINRWIDVIVDVPDATGLIPGQFLRAELAGRRYDRVIGIPYNLISRDGAIWVVDAENLLKRLDLVPLFDRDGRSFFVPPEDTLSVQITAPRSGFLTGQSVSPTVWDSAEQQAFANTLDEAKQ